MTGIRSRTVSIGPRELLLGIMVGIVLLLSVSAPALSREMTSSPTGVAPSFGVPASTVGPPPPTNTANASAIGLYGVPTTEVIAGVPAGMAWEALNATGDRQSEFEVNCELSVTMDANGSNAPAWVNATTTGPLARTANGSFVVPFSAWGGGVLPVSVSVAESGSMTVRLFGSALPSAVASVGLEVLPDRYHLVLYDPDYLRSSDPNETYWHVRDRFGDPAPGAMLVVVLSSASGSNQTLVPVTGAASGETGAWVNYTAPASVNATFEVLDEAGTVLLGPVELLVPTNSTTASTPSLSPIALVAVGLVAVGGFVGFAVLMAGGRPRPRRPATAEEEELRRLAEGRATVVELVRRKGPLTIREIEAAWEPPPAPPALSDWVASLVADGTLTATLDEGREARFSLAAPTAPTPKVTVDAEELERGIARRDAAVEEDRETGDPDDGPPSP